jgi:hypothetical protein
MFSHSVLRKHVLEEAISPMPTGHSGETDLNNIL